MVPVDKELHLRDAAESIAVLHFVAVEVALCDF